MSQMNYNNVAMQIVKTNDVQVTPKMSSDGADYLYTECLIDIQAIINPGATSYTVDGKGNPVVQLGVLAPDTALAIRHALQEPRKPLSFNFAAIGQTQNFVSIDNNALDTSDAYIGPIPEVLSFNQVAGTKKIVCRFRIRFWIYDCPTNTQVAPVVLSNRWQMSQSIDESRLSTNVTTGEFILRLDAANFRNVTADDFRNQMLPPIPLTFKRISIEVTVNSVGDRLAYKVIDKEMMYYIGATGSLSRRGVEKFEARYHQGTIPSETASIPGPWSYAAVEAKAWGNSQSNIDDMQTWLIQLAIQRLAVPFGRAPNPATGEGMLRSIEVGELLHDRVADIRMVVQIPATNPTPFGGGGGVLNWNRLGVPNRLLVQTFTTDGKNPQPPNDNSTRGTYYGQVLAQALASPCTSAGSFDYYGLEKGEPIDNYSEDQVPVNLFISEGPQPGSAQNNMNVAPTQNVGMNEYNLDTLYSQDRYVKMAPVSGGFTSGSSGQQIPLPPEVMVLANPTCYRIVQGTAEQITQKSPIPQPLVNDPNWTLMVSDFQPAAPIIDPGGFTPIYRTNWRYVYASTNGMGPGEATSLPSAVTPWTNYTFAQNQYLQSDFVHGIIDGGSQTGGTAGIDV